MMKYIIANWKANKTLKETVDWFTELSVFDFEKLKEVEIIACLPFVFLATAKKEIEKNRLLIKLGSQNVSHFEGGPYTGVITANMLKDVVQFVMIGHSERRKLLNETDEMVVKKTIIALKNNLIPIVCVSNLNQVEYWQKGVKEIRGIENTIFLYEPLEAIGTGKAENPQEIKKKIAEIKKMIELPVLYGGSVTPENVNLYFKIENTDGVAIGRASLDPKSFLKILNVVASFTCPVLPGTL